MVITPVMKAVNFLDQATTTAAKINQSQDLSTIKVGLQDEIFQGAQSVLGGVDAASRFCYLLKAATHRDEETWGFHLLEAQAQGATSQCLKLEQQIDQAKLKNKATYSLRAKLVHAKKRERKLEVLAKDIKTFLLGSVGTSCMARFLESFIG